MDARKETLADVIEVLAHQTGATDAFVQQTQEAFVRRGIDLAADATPYFMALADTFRREENVRRSRLRTLEHLARLDEQLAAFDEGHQSLLSSLREIRTALERRARLDGGASA